MSSTKKNKHINLFVILILGWMTATANASVIDFSSGQPATTFADGTFDHFYTSFNTPAGFHPFSFPGHSTGAYNSYGVNNLFINFDTQVILNSIDISNLGDTYAAENLTVSLYDTGSNLITSKTLSLTQFWQTLTFDTDQVNHLELTWTGGGTQAYLGAGDLGNYAWYYINNVTYTKPSPSAVPIPSAIWLFGSSIAGFIGFSRRNTKSITQRHQSTL